MIEVAHIVMRITTDLTRFNTGMAAAEARAKTTSERMSVAGMRMTKYLSLPLAAIGYSAVKQAFHFNDAMKQIQYGAGASATEVGHMTKAVKDMAMHSTQGPEELAKGLYHVESLGYRGANALKILDASRKGAQLGLADLEETTSGLGGAMRVFHIHAKDAEHTMAIMKATVGAGNMRFDDLTHALGTGVLPVAKQAGLTFRDVMASMTVFTDENQNAASSMTRLRTALMMMQNPSKHAEEAMNQLGLSGLQIGVSIRKGKDGWLNTIKLIHDREQMYIKDLMHGHDMYGHSVRKMTRAQAQTAAFRAVAQSFGGSKTASQILLLINQVDLLRRKFAQVDHTTSKFSQNVKDSTKLWTNQLRIAWSQIRVALIDLGEALAPLVVGFAKFIAVLAKGFMMLPKPLRTFVAGLLVMLALLGPMLIVGSAMVTMWERYKTAALAVRGAMITLNATMMANPILLIAAAIAILIILFFKWKKFHEAVVKSAKIMWDGLKKAYEGVKNAFSDAFNWIKNFVLKEWPYIIGALFGPVGLAVAAIYKHWDTIKGIFMKGINAVLGWVKSNWGKILNFLLNPMYDFELLWRGVWYAIQNTVMKAFPLIIHWVKSGFSAVVNAIKSAAIWIYNAAIRGFWMVIHFLASLPGRMRSGTVRIFQAIVNVARSWIGAVYSAFTAWGPRVMHWFAGLPGRLGSWVKRAMLRIVNWLKQAAVWVYNAAKHLGTMMKNGIADGLKGLGGAIAGELDPLKHLPGGRKLEKGVASLFKAAGGPVTAGQPYIVGEKGAEWFVPNTSGRIIPHGQGGGGKSAPTVNVEHMSVRGDDDIYSIASQLSRKVRMA